MCQKGLIRPRIRQMIRIRLDPDLWHWQKGWMDFDSLR
jgi:hypothetical protein